MPRRISYAQNGEDVRIWHAFGPVDRLAEFTPLVYVEVGANEPRNMSLTASLYDMGWHGLLVEADPDLAAVLASERPRDQVVHAAAAAKSGELTFYRVPGSGLGTLDLSEAQAAQARGFAVQETRVPALTLNQILQEFLESTQSVDIHAMSIDVEGAEDQVLAGLDLQIYRPWVMCIEAVEPGTSRPTHQRWEKSLKNAGYREVAFDGINRWYVAEERANQSVGANAGAPADTTIAQAIAIPLNVIDVGEWGWSTADVAHLQDRDNRAFNRTAWQRELILGDVARRVPDSEYQRQIDELRAALVSVEGSRTFMVSRRLARVGKKGLHVIRGVRRRLPQGLDARLIRERHLRHVTANFPHLTDAAFLTQSPVDDVRWVASDDPASPHYASRPPLPPGLTLEKLTDADDVLQWLNDYPFDSDDQLDSRMDNHDDEVGRVRAALRTRLRLADAPANPHWAGGNRVVLDVRSLQSPAFGNRGIGRFAKAVLMGARETIPDTRITLIVDPGLHPLPSALVGECRQVTRIKESEVAQYSVFVQPSPMTHRADPIIPLLHSNAHCIAVVFDFIPLHYPSLYLRHAAERAEYAANLDALRFYSEYVCISHVVRRELSQFLGAPLSGPSQVRAVVAWPRDVQSREHTPSRSPSSAAKGPIVLMTGDEPRKNTYGGLAGIAAATTDIAERDVIVVGFAGQGDRVHHWSIAAAMRPGEAKTLNRVSDAELHEILSQASCVVVPSFDEGLSLPVIEALQAGVPVVASDIPSHRELVGRGLFLCDPRSPRSIARAIRRTRGKSRVFARQARHLSYHKHATLEAVIAKSVADNIRPAEVPEPLSARPTRSMGQKISLGIATPWVPQRTGVADFSTAVFTELAHLVDLTVYTTSGADVEGDLTPHVKIHSRHIDEVFADPAAVRDRHDAFITVVGNSHYHLPFVEALSEIDSMVVAHDTRMVEFYMALRGRGGVEQLMLTTRDPQAPRSISPHLDEQIDDMRLLQNAGFWEVAQRAERLIVHSPSAAPRLTRETGKAVYVLPFANQRVPHTAEVTEEDRIEARKRLGLNDYPEGTLHLATFGYVDVRTKMTDVVLEAAAWLTQWGHSVALHLVGAASSEDEDLLNRKAQDAGIGFFKITGFQTDEEFRDWLLAIDIGVQLRVSPLLGVSGPLSDLAAFGTPAVASSGLCVDVDTPAYVHRLPDAVSSLTVAEAIESMSKNPIPHAEREAMRRDYLEAKSPSHYARLLLDLVEESI